MKLSNKRKWFYIVVSLLLAVVIWFYVDNTSAESVSFPVNDVPVEFLNEERGLTSKGLMLISGDDATVDIVLTMPRGLTYSFDPDNFRLFADLSSVSSTGKQTVTFTPVYPSNVNAQRISIKSPTLRTVEVVVGEMFRKEVDVHCRLEGSVAPGYLAGTPQFASTIELRGQQADLTAVSYAQVTLNIESATSTIMEQLTVELYDANDNRITNRYIHPASETIQVTLPVVPASEIPLTVDFVESPGLRLASFDWSLDHDTIALSGSQAALSELGEIVLGTVDLSEIDGEAEIPFEVEIPEGLRNISGFTSVTLTIRARSIETRSFAVTRFEVENYGGELPVEIVNESVAVTLRGTSEDFEAFDAEGILLIADLSEIADASGNYTVPARVVIEGEADFAVPDEYELTVRIEDPAAQELTEPGADGGEETTEEVTQP